MPSAPGTDLMSENLIFETNIDLRIPPEQLIDACSGYAEVMLSSIESLQREVRVRVEITPLAAQTTRYWAFVAVTSNDTQETSILTP